MHFDFTSLSDVNSTSHFPFCVLFDGVINSFVYCYFIRVMLHYMIFVAMWGGVAALCIFFVVLFDGVKALLIAISLFGYCSKESVSLVHF